MHVPGGAGQRGGLPVGARLTARPGTGRARLSARARTAEGSARHAATGRAPRTLHGMSYGLPSGAAMVSAGGAAGVSLPTALRTSAMPTTIAATSSDSSISLRAESSVSM